MTPRDVRRTAMTISEFARRSGLSHKALRLYDMSGLLPPAEVDPYSGYRLYTVEQLDRARRISLLRQLDMPLATVAEVLSTSEEAAMQRIEGWWAAREASMRDKRGSLEYLRTRFTHPDAAAVSRAVTVCRVAETKVATIRHEVDQQALVEAMIGATTEIRRHLLAAGAEPTGEVWWLYHGYVTPDSEAPVEACMPFAGTVDPAGPITIRMEPAHTQVRCTITRDECCYPQIMAGYDAVESWAVQAGRSPAGPPREIYFAEWSATAADEPFVHIAVPIEGRA
jgi:DNA-binding transcriptional MerR regulator